jgi:hypothetical protein
MKRLKGGPRHRLRLELCAVVPLLHLFAGVTPGRASDRTGQGAWFGGIGVQQRVFDSMSIGDSRPTARADAGVRGSIERLLTPRLVLGVSAYFGGSWFDWSDPSFNTAGNIEDVSWDVRLGLDRALPLGERGVALVGVGVEYGEAHSWTHTLGASSVGGQDISDEGPRCYRTGGFARLAAVSPMWRGMALCAEVSDSVYGAHASDPTFGTQFNWLGHSLAVSAGVRFQIWQGRASGP